MSGSKDNNKVIFSSRPTGALTRDHFAFELGEIPEPADRDVVVRNIYSSVEPYLRVLMTGDMGGARQQFEVGTVLPARVVGEVVSSRNPDFAEGEYVYGHLRWEQFSLCKGGDGLRRIAASKAPLSSYVGVLGTSGLTAYVGMLETGQPLPGESVYVSAAAGAVGQLAGQLAKLKGARVVGSAGSDEKVAFLKSELGFDDAFNYKKCSDLSMKLKEIIPAGIDLSFENVGGAHLDAVLASLNVSARIVLCGAVSQYESDSVPGLKNLMSLVFNQARVLGFHVSFHEHKLPEVIEEMSGWLRSGRIKYREHIVEGLENGPNALVGLLHGENIGKTILQIGEDNSSRAERVAG